MKVSIIRNFFMLLLLCLLVGCSKKPTGPSQKSDGNLLPNGSFELKGEPTLEGWQAADTNLASLAEDAAPGGGRWSLKLEADWAPTSGFITALVPEIHDGDVLRLSAFVRSVGDDGGGFIALLVGSSLNRPVSKHKVASSIEWTFLSFEDTLIVGESDSVWVLLSSFHTEIVPRIGQFDLVSLEKINE